MTTSSPTTLRRESLKLGKPPIVEAVLDIDCDMPPKFDPDTLESDARRSLAFGYPHLRKKFTEKYQLRTGDESSVKRVNRVVEILQFRPDDEKQIVQIRAGGFSFNRLAPYSTLDDYLPEIQKTWGLFLSLAAPIQITAVRLRYINRFSLPLVDGKIQLGEYLEVEPRLPQGNDLTLASFLHQHTAVEERTANIANVVLATQPIHGSELPLIFDITVSRIAPADPQDWTLISETIQSLRRLKNLVFHHSLTPQCLMRFNDS